MRSIRYQLADYRHGSFEYLIDDLTFKNEKHLILDISSNSDYVVFKHFLGVQLTNYYFKRTIKYFDANLARFNRD